MISRLLLFSAFEFAVYVFGALVFFSLGLLLWDSLSLKKDKSSLLCQSIGSFLLSITYVADATLLTHPLMVFSTQVVKIVGLTIFLIGVVREPILRKPHVNAFVLIPVTLLSFISQMLVPFSAVLFLFIGLWYWRLCTESLDRQLKPLAIAFFLLAVAEYIKMTFAWADTNNVFWSKMLMEYSYIWNIHLFVQLLGVAVVASWVWGYICFRLQIQLFVSMLGSIFMIFLTTTIFFSYLLLQNIENDALRQLKVNASVFQYSISQLRTNILAHAKTNAESDSIRNAIISKDTETLYKVTSEVFSTLNLSSFTTASADGEVLMRAEDRHEIGDTVRSDPFVAKALAGELAGGIASYTGASQSYIAITSAAPVTDVKTGAVIGALLLKLPADNTLVDGIKKTTGLDATIFVGDVRSATTLIGPDGVSRYSGTKETNTAILSSVLKSGKDFVGKTEVLQEPYYAAYLPLRAPTGEPIGMLFIGRPQADLLGVAKQSLTMTFMGSVFLMLLSLYPVYALSRYIREQAEA